MEDSLAVQVLESPGDVHGQAEPHAPRQTHVAAQQLLQVAAVDVLDHRETDTESSKILRAARLFKKDESCF